MPIFTSSHAARRAPVAERLELRPRSGRELVRLLEPDVSDPSNAPYRQPGARGSPSSPSARGRFLRVPSAIAARCRRATQRVALPSPNGPSYVPENVASSFVFASRTSLSRQTLRTVHRERVGAPRRRRLAGDFENVSKCHRCAVPTSHATRRVPVAERTEPRLRSGRGLVRLREPDVSVPSNAPYRPPWARRSPSSPSARGRFRKFLQVLSAVPARFALRCPVTVSHNSSKC